MANEKYTRKQFLLDMMETDLSDEQRECAKKWLEALNKKSDYKPENKTRRLNEELAAKVVAAMQANPDEQINAKWLSTHIAGITTPQKAVGVMRVAIELGKVERFEEKGKAFYRLV